MLPDTDGVYRQVKLKLYNTALHPYVLAFLYDAALFKFHVARVDFTDDWRVTKVDRHYKMQPEDVLHVDTAENHVCSDPNLANKKAVVFLPEFEASSEKSYQPEINSMLKALKAHFGDDLYLMLGDQATVENFHNVMDCSQVSYFLMIGSEYVDSDVYAGAGFWAYDPTTASGGQDPYITAKDFPQGDSELKTVIAGGCHLMTDNTQDSLCHQLTAPSKVAVNYSGGISSIDIPAGIYTLSEFVKQSLDTGDFSQKRMDTIAGENDPFVKNSAAPWVYLLNFTDGDLLATPSNVKQTMHIKSDDIIRFGTDGKPIKLSLRTSDGLVCELESSNQQGDTLDQLRRGEYSVEVERDESGKAVHCFVSNINDVLPVAENASLGGTGVRYGVADIQNTLDRCVPAPTAFEYTLEDDSHGQCHVKSFTLSGHFVGDAWQPLIEAAQQSGLSHPGTIEQTVVGAQKNYGVITTGLYDIGEWRFTVETEGLDDGCQLTLDDSVVYSDTVGTTPLQLHLSHINSAHVLAPH